MHKHKKTCKKLVKQLKCLNCSDRFFSIDGKTRCPHCISNTMKTHGDMEYWEGDSSDLTIYETKHSKRIDFYCTHNIKKVKVSSPKEQYGRGSRAASRHEKVSEYSMEEPSEQNRSDSSVDWRKKKLQLVGGSSGGSGDGSGGGGGGERYMRPSSSGFGSGRGSGFGAGRGSRTRGLEQEGSDQSKQTTRRYIPPSVMGSGNWR